MNASLESLEYNLRYFWPVSFDRIEELSNGTVAAFFKCKDAGIFYEIILIFHPHRYAEGGGFVQYRFGRMTFGGASLTPEYKEEIRAQMRHILTNHGWGEEKKSRFA